jgi:hypothetical protein
VFSQKIKLPRKREKKRKKTQDTRKKKISSTPNQIFGRLAVFHSLTHTVEHEILRETKFEPRTHIHPFRLNSFREKKRATHDLLKKAVWFFRFLFSFVVATNKEIYNTHTHKRVLYHHLQREKSARKEVHGQKRKRE